MFRSDSNRSNTFLTFLIIALATVSVFGQTSKKPVKKTTRPVPVTSQTPVTEPAPDKTEPSKPPLKKNDRPATQQSGNGDAAAFKPNYFYEFSQPNFIVSKIAIEHDESGNGRIEIMKKDWSEPDSDPIKLSETTLSKIRAAYDALDFLNSSDSYQYEKDYSHLGNNRFRLVRDGKEREVTFNWTENKDAKALMDEYRKLANQFIWIFDMNVARANQPLDAPKQMEAIESYFSRGELSDPAQLIPYLKEVSLDERIPLIARNRATKLIATIEKETKSRKLEKSGLKTGLLAITSHSETISYRT